MPVDIGRPQLRAGVRALLADADAHPAGPAAGVQQAGDVRDPAAVPHLAVAVIGRCPRAGAASTAASPSPSASSAASSPAELTTAQGTQICTDLAHWADSSAVNNADSPVFNQVLTSDETEAQGTALGNDLVTLDNDLQTEYSAALFPGPPGYPTDRSTLGQDCATYGVTINSATGTW